MFALAAVAFKRFVDVPVGHFRQRAETEFQRVARAGPAVDQPLIEMRLVHQPRLAAHRRRGRIIRMRGERDAGFLGHRHERVEKPAVPPPQFLRRDRREIPGRGVPVIDHVPDHAVGNRLVAGSVHRDDFRAAASPRALDAARHAGEREVVADDRECPRARRCG